MGAVERRKIVGELHWCRRCRLPLAPHLVEFGLELVEARDEGWGELAGLDGPEDIIDLGLILGDHPVAQLQVLPDGGRPLYRWALRRGTQQDRDAPMADVHAGGSSRTAWCWAAHQRKSARPPPRRVATALDRLQLKAPGQSFRRQRASAPRDRSPLRRRHRRAKAAPPTRTARRSATPRAGRPRTPLAPTGPDDR